jgi:hypothetical protein
MSAEALATKATRDEDRRYIERIVRAASGMDNLVGDLVHVTGIGQETLAVTRAREAVRSSCARPVGHSPPAEQQHIALGVSDPPAELVIAADRARVVQPMGTCSGTR